jgi:hypothetical protein
MRAVLVVRLLVIGVIAAASMVSSGCVTVQAWERGRLADPQMKFEEDAALAAYQAHWLEAREGASGGSGVQGGGCGCK